MRKLITCPESAHLEEIEFCEDPASGQILRITACSAHNPAESVDCEMECAKRINQRRDATRAHDDSSQGPESDHSEGRSDAR